MNFQAKKKRNPHEISSNFDRHFVQPSRSPVACMLRDLTLGMVFPIRTSLSLALEILGKAVIIFERLA
ncbi:hypothetical protein [uncultured Sulfitobacter sp.]|uniref:hypothetical protein n=1 Tax=uncultured Sulfitobacter sp. TaxID=191468 RepID=UPI002596E976|nr:hypothetical protein [uncultured Sulfitobacter sp.]